MRLRKLKVPKDPDLNQAMRLSAASITVGVVAAIVVQLFRLLVHAAEYYLLGGIAGYLPPDELGRAEVIASSGLWLVPVVTTLGGLCSGIIVYALAEETAGGGENGVIHSFHQLGGAVRKRVWLVKSIASAVTIGSGGAAGREGPMAQICASLAYALMKPFKLAVAEKRLIMIAGTAAGISAIFSSPLGAAFLAVEVLYSKLDIEVEGLMYAIIAAAVGYAVNGFFVGWESVFHIPSNLAFTQSTQLFWYGLLGILAGALSVAVPYVYYTVEDWFSRLPIPRVFKPAVGGLALGLIAVFCPYILGSGYGWMDKAIHGELAVSLMLTIGLLKIVAFSLTIGSGGSGGVFAPVLFSGAMFGSAAAVGLNQFLDNGPEVATMTIVGMAAFFAGVGRAPVATMVMATELTGGHGIIVPTMIAVALSFLVQTIVSNWFPSLSQTLYKAQVPTRGDSPTHQQEYLQVALEMVQRGGVNLSGPVGIPELHKFLELGQPISVGDNGEFLYRADVRDGSVIIGKAIRDLDFVSDALIVGISRGEDQREITPRGSTTLESGDSLILICHPDNIDKVGQYLVIACRI